MANGKHCGSEFRRKFVQLLSAVVFNLNATGFSHGTLFRGKTKGICVPGLNCYSCPGAIGACPIGSLQVALNGLPNLPLYVVGLLIIFGALLGRAVCAFLCPFGLVQEFLHKIPGKKLPKNRLTRKLSLLKYIVLIVFVLALPLHALWKQGIVTPTFCKFLCPAGTLEGGIPIALVNAGVRASLGWLFGWKGFVLLCVLTLSVFLYRPFCRFLCPLGAIYSMFNRIALVGIKVNEERCTHCGRCTKQCKMDTLSINDRECIRCGACAATCPCGAIVFNPNINRPKKGEQHEKNHLADACAASGNDHTGACSGNCGGGEDRPGF